MAEYKTNNWQKANDVKLLDAQRIIQNAGYDVEVLGLSPHLWSGEEPDSFVAFWLATKKQPGGQYTLCVVSQKDGKDQISHKGNYEEHGLAQEAFCRLVYPYQR